MLKKGDWINAVQIPLENQINELINLAPFIVGFVSDGNYNGIFNSDFNPEIIKNENIINPIALVIGGVKYTEVSTEIELYNNEKTWYWESARKLFMIRLPNGLNRWKVSSMIAGVSFAVYKTNMSIDNFDGVYNGTKYQNILLSVPEINEKVDDLFSGVPNYEGGSISLQNNNGRFSRFNEDGEFLGREFFFESWYYSESTPTVSLVQDFTGLISKIKTGSEISISYKDPRDKFIENTAARVLDLTVWTSADSSYTIPKVWGKPKDCELKCINENTVGAVWQLMLADVSALDLHAVDKLYYQGNSIAVPTVLIADGIAYIEVNKTTYPNKDSFTADLQGYEDDTNTLIENPLDMIVEVIDEIYGQTYSSIYYDTAAWTAAYSYVYNPSFYIKEKTKLKDFFKLISASSGGVFEINKTTGKYSFKIVASDLSLTIIIPEIRFQPESDRNEIEYSGENIVQVCSVGYNKKHKANTYKIYTDNTKYTEVRNITNTTEKEKYFETDITTYEHAQLSAKKYLYLFGRKLRYIEKTIPLNAETKQMRAGFFISIQWDKDGFNMGYMRTYLLSVSKNYNSGSVSFSGYMFEQDNSGFMQFVESGVSYEAQLTDNSIAYNFYTI